MKYLFFVLPVIAIIASIFVSKYVASKKGVKKGLLTHAVSMMLVFCLCFIGTQFIASATDDSKSLDSASSQTEVQDDETATTGAEEAEESEGVGGLGLIAAALAIGLAGIGGGIAVAAGAPAAIGATAENPDVFGKAIIFVVLGEAIALYGFVISCLIIFS